MQKLRKSKKVKKVMTTMPKGSINLSFLEASNGWQQVYHTEVFNVMKAIGVDINNEEFGFYFWQFKNVAIAGVRKPTESINNYEFFIMDKLTNKILETKTGKRVIFEEMKYDPENIVNGRHIRQYIEERY